MFCVCTWFRLNQLKQNNLAQLEPTDTESIRQALALQGARVGQLERTLHDVANAIGNLTQTVNLLEHRLQDIAHHLSASPGVSASSTATPSLSSAHSLKRRQLH